MVYCCVPNCRSRSDRKPKLNIDGSKITFHVFSRTLTKEWALAIRRQGEKPNILWTPEQNKTKSVVCSRHFLPTDFKHGMKTKCLLPSAVPSIFYDDTQEFNKEKSLKSLPPGEQKRKKEKKSQGTSIEEDTNPISPPSDPKLVPVWICSKIGNDCKPTATIVNDCDGVPSFIKQALIEKEKIELTYKETNATNNSSLVSNGNLPSQLEELRNNPIMNNSLKIEVDSSNEDSVPSSSSTNISMPCFESLPPVTHTIVNAAEVFHTSTSSLDPQNTIHDPKILSIESLSTTKVKMCDASTSAMFPTAKDKSGEYRKQISGYRKRIKMLTQKNRRYKSYIVNMKHSVFCELQKRRYLSQKPDYFIEKQGCLLDRHSIRECQSSDTEESEEEIE